MFVEDRAHQEVVGGLVERVAHDEGVPCVLTVRSATHGHGRVATELGRYSRDLARQGVSDVAFVIVATDANCRGWRARRDEMLSASLPVPVVFAIPDPHVERWLLLDGAAFKSVVGGGCSAPDQKCQRQRYKQMLAQQIRLAGIAPSFGGIEFARDIVSVMDLDRAGNADASFARFPADLRQAVRAG